MLSHAWPFIVVLIVVFGGGIVRSIFKALTAGASSAVREAMSQLPAQILEVQQHAAQGGIAGSDDAARIASERAAARRAQMAAAVAAFSETQPAQTRAKLAEIAKALESPAAAGSAAETKQARTRRPQREHVAVSTPGYTRPGEFLAPRPKLKALHRLAVVPPLEPFAARAPLAPLTAARP